MLLTSSPAHDILNELAEYFKAPRTRPHKTLIPLSTGKAHGTRACLYFCRNRPLACSSNVANGPIGLRRAGDKVGFLLTVCVLFIAAGGGIGGGGAIIPLYLLFLGTIAGLSTSSTTHSPGSTPYPLMNVFCFAARL